MRAPRGSAAVVVCLVIAAPALGGCGGDAGIPAVTKPVATPPTAQTRRALTRPESPESTVVRFWDSIRDGALPVTLAIYDRDVVAAVGTATFAGMLSEQRAALQDQRLNVLGADAAGGGRLVSAEAVPKLGTKVRHSFFLRRAGRERPGSWRIVYDTLSASVLQPYVQTQTQRAIDPAATPGRKAIAAGDQALRAYREASLSRPGDSRSASAGR